MSPNLELVRSPLRGLEARRLESGRAGWQGLSASGGVLLFDGERVIRVDRHSDRCEALVALGPWG